jgi:hypothetical protein
VAIVTLAQIKSQLNIPSGDTSNDTELALYGDAATTAVEEVVGTVTQVAVTEKFHGGKVAVTLASPVVSVTSVTDFGNVLTSADWSLNDRTLTRVAGLYPLPFLPGVNSVVVAYTAGLAVVPAGYQLAALIIVQHMWETQRPAGRSPFNQQSDEYDPRYSYSIPRRALELLGEPIAGFA